MYLSDFGRQVSLKDFLAFEKTVVHDGKEIQVNKVIRIEDAERIVILIQCEDLREYPVHGIAFADEFLIGSFKDESSVLAGDVCRIVRAVVRDDVDVIEFLRVLQELQVSRRSDSTADSLCAGMTIANLLAGSARFLSFRCHMPNTAMTV